MCVRACVCAVTLQACTSTFVRLVSFVTSSVRIEFEDWNSEIGIMNWRHVFSNSPQQIMDSRTVLQKLESLLQELPERPKSYGDMNDPDYTEEFIDYLECEREVAESVRKYLSTRICQLQEAISGVRDRPLRICSVGCGHGVSDKKYLTEVAKKLPQIVIQYVGVDTNAASCSLARKNLLDSPYEATIINANILDIDVKSPPISEQRFDLVLLAHSTYYFDKLEPLFEKLTSITRPGGEIQIIVAAGSPEWRLAPLFFDREMKFPYRFAADLVKEMKTMGLKYTEVVLPGELNVAPYVKERFSSRSGRNVLSFICHTKLERYPPEVTALCIEYFTDLYKGGEKKFKFDANKAIAIRVD